MNSIVEYISGHCGLAYGLPIAEVGFFVLPVLELSVRDGVSYEDAGTGAAWGNTVRGAIDFELPLDRFEPYIGANAGYFASDRYASSPEAAPELGVKFFFT